MLLDDADGCCFVGRFWARGEGESECVPSGVVGGEISECGQMESDFLIGNDHFSNC